VELLQWFVEKGDTIKAFDKICEVQSDKATVEITSRYDGKVVAMHHEIGGEVKVGSVLVDIEVKGGGGDKTGGKKGANTSAAAAATAPATTQTQAPTPGFSREAGLPKNYNAPDPVNINGGKVLTTPAVRKVARERGIDLKTIIGTGPKGRILKEDVLRGPTLAAVAAAPSSSAQQQQQQQQPAAPTPVFRNSTAEDTVVPIRGVQRLMVKSMEAAREVQHLTLGEEICVDALVNTRTDLKKIAEAMGIKLTFMPLFIKAASLALAAYPSLNATTAPDMSSVTRHGAHNIGVAMDSPSGLVVPVIRNCQDRSVFEIAAELNRLQTAVMSGKVDSKDLQGGTFTLSNIGSVGGTFATPVVVVPQVAIGALCRFQTVAKYPEGMSTAQVIASGALPVPTTVMNVAWSADHRVVDGATVARFSNAWRGYIENPASMLAQLR
jgi:2-oxoisovalerate dehydrogenase E2 component (dihydrolipoyl transacylase)